MTTKLPKDLEIAVYMNGVFDSAVSADYAYKPEEYMWYLGIEVLYDLMGVEYVRKTRDEEMCYLGIRIMIDYRDPKRIELWRKII